MIFETIELNRHIEAYDAMTVNVFVPYTGTVLKDLCIEKGYVTKETIVSDTHHSMLDQPQLPIKELDGLLRTFPLYVHFDKTYWSEIPL